VKYIERRLKKLNTRQIYTKEEKLVEEHHLLSSPCLRAVNFSPTIAKSSNV
jgi:hypothetical protein